MSVSIVKFIRHLEISWDATWVVLFLGYYVLQTISLNSINFVVLNQLDLVLFGYILQVIFIIASLLSFLVLILKSLSKNEQKADKQNSDAYTDYMADGARLVFPFVNLAYYFFDLFENPFLKANFSHFWLILPWLLWLPIIFEFSAQVKQEFSWIK